MSTFRILLTTIAIALPLCGLVSAEEKSAPSTTKSTPLDKLKSLSGDWDVKAMDEHHGMHGGTTTFKTTAGGSTVQETLFGGSDHEMLTMYYMDGDKLALTHYCVLSNRPVMREQKQSDPKKLVLACTNEDNAKILNDTHMHQVTYTFVDADHVKSEWVLYKDGKQDGVHTFELSRKKKSAKTE